MVNRLATFPNLPTVFESTPIRLTPAPWYNHLRIQTFIQTHFFSSCTRVWNSSPPDVSAISTLPAFKHAIINLF